MDRFVVAPHAPEEADQHFSGATDRFSDLPAKVVKRLVHVFAEQRVQILRTIDVRIFKRRLARKVVNGIETLS